MVPCFIIIQVKQVNTLIEDLHYLTYIVNLHYKMFSISGKRSVITDTQLPDGNESVHQLHVMEEQIRRLELGKLS